MGKTRSKLKMSETTCGAAIADAFAEIESLKDELQDWYDNLPENFQNGEKGEQLTEAIGMLEANSEPTIGAKFQEWLDARKVSYAVFTDRRRTSRSARRYDCVSMIDAVIESLGLDDAKSVERGNDDMDVDSLINELTDARDEWDNVEFPGMFG